MPPHPIVGHARQLTELAADIEGGNVSHAYLFAGSPHLGKTTVAKWFARELITNGKTFEEKETIDHALNRLIHPDFLALDQLWIEEQCEDFAVIGQSTNVPQQHRAKAPTMKTDVISIDDVREIQMRLQETGGGTFRFCFIRGIERMREEAANAFLKILEEPPEGRVFLLTTDALSVVLPTILSRSRVLRFQRVADRDIAPLLKELNEQERQFILHLSQGAPGTAIRLLSDPDALRAEHLLHEKALSFWTQSAAIDRMMNLVPLHERGGESDRFLFHLALALREQPRYTSIQERALTELVEGLRTNANRPLMTEHFALQTANKEDILSTHGYPISDHRRGPFAG